MQNYQRACCSRTGVVQGSVSALASAIETEIDFGADFAACSPEAVLARGLLPLCPSSQRKRYSRSLQGRKGTGQTLYAFVQRQRSQKTN